MTIYEKQLNYYLYLGPTGYISLSNGWLTPGGCYFDVPGLRYF